MPGANYFVRITRPFSDLSGVIRQWAMRCEKLVVYEHVGSETEKVHIHAAIYGAGYDKKSFKNDYKILKLNGNQDHSWKEWDGSDLPIVYMTKGILEPCYVKAYDLNFLSELRQRWVAPVSRVKKSSWEKLFEDFEVVAPQPPPFDPQRWLESSEIAPVSSELYLDALLTAACKFVREKDGYVWTPSYGNRVKCCFYSYVFKHKISVSNDFKKRHVKFAD